MSLAETSRSINQSPFSASQEALGGTGIAFEWVGHLDEVRRQQLNHWTADHQATFQELRTHGVTLECLFAHLGRRIQHQAEGLNQALQATESARSRSGALHRQVWAPVVARRNRQAETVAPLSVMGHLQRDHERLDALLTVLEQGLQESQSGSDYEVDVLSMALAYMDEYPDAVHHPLEDRIFARLLAKPVTPEEAADVRRNADGHAQLTEATHRLRERIDALDDGDGGDLQRAAALYIEWQRQHMRFEEERIFPLANRYFDPADWQAISADAAARASADPLYELRLERFETLFQFVAGEA